MPAKKLLLTGITKNDSQKAAVRLKQKEPTERDSPADMRIHSAGGSLKPRDSFKVILLFYFLPLIALIRSAKLFFFTTNQITANPPIPPTTTTATTIHIQAVLQPVSAG